MMLAAMVAMVLLVAAPAMADTVLRGTAVINQSNEGDQVAINRAEQDATASQYQYNPGGDATDDDSAQYEDIEIEGNSLQGDEIEIEGDVDESDDETGGAGGTGSQYQYQNQRQVQEATATGPTFDADQTQYTRNVVAF